ncbi:MAG TPA: hypothetical protein VI603_05735 [Saprospiraceae bacterium]|nr:hypothetical protein [Saprospiraceae bacterium]
MKVWNKKVEEQPKLEIVPAYWDQVMDIAVWVLLVGMISFPAYLFVVPTGSKDMESTSLIFALLGISTVIGFHYLKRYPHRFNYLARITPENALRQYTLALRMMRMLNLVMLLVFISILIMMYIQDTQDKQLDEGLIVMFIMIIGFIPMGYYLWKSMEKKRASGRFS